LPTITARTGNLSVVSIIVVNMMPSAVPAATDHVERISECV
jgi:hypothetical protein